MSHGSVLLSDRYQLMDRIARGAVGEVWRAVDLVLDRPVAVKLLRAGYADHPETLTRFRAEARHAGSLSHPGIAQIYDYSEVGSPLSPYLVMELVDGPSLAGLLASRPLDPAQAMDVVAQTAEALDAAHSVGLVHRDIKPANLLVGPGLRVKITDFGIAHAAGSAPITRTGMLVGTPAYLAPERAEGGPSTPASDLYSLGVVAYQCLAGAAPFSGPPLEVALAHRHRPLPPLPRAVPPAVAALVGDLTAKDPAARPASAGDVARRAGRLRDAVAGSTAIWAGGGPGPGTVTDPGSHPCGDQPAADLTGLFQAEHATTLSGTPPTLADAPVPGAQPVSRPLRGGRGRLRRGAVLATAAAVTAGLVGWLTSGLTRGVPPRQHVAAHAPASHAPAVPAPRRVRVNGGALVGQPAGVARRLLRQLGLQPQVVWVPRGQQSPGTVVSVHPTGQVATGAIITINVAVQPPGHRHGHGNGNGNGNGGG